MIRRILLGASTWALLGMSADVLGGTGEIPAALTSQPCGPMQASANGIRSPRFATPIDQLFEGFAHADGPGAMVAVIWHGKVVHLRGYGFSDLAFHSAWTPRTRYRLASITKTFTAAAVLELVDRQQISLDAPIRRYLPELPAVADKIRISDLLTMSSGLWEDEDLMELTGNALVVLDGAVHHMTVRDMEAHAVVQDRLDFRPGTLFRYTDTNYRLLARVIEKVTGRSYAAALRDLVLAPARMRYSAPYPTLDSTFRCQVPTYVQNGGHWADIGAFALAASGDGAMISTMEDMVAWSQYMSAARPGGLPARYLRQADIENRIARPGSIYRLGIMMFRHRGYLVLVHQGATGTLFAFVPDLDLTIIIFTNGLEEGLDMSDRNRDLASRILDVVMDRSESTDLSPPTTGITAAALPLEHSPLPAGIFPAGTFLCESSGEVLDIGNTGEHADVALMGMSLSTWEQGKEKTWQGMDSHLQVFVRVPRVPRVPGAVEAVESGEVNADSACRFAVVQPRRVDQELARGLAGWYYSDALKTHYRILTEGDETLIVAGNDVRPSARHQLRRLSSNVLRSGSLFLRLSRTASGDIGGFSLSTGRVRNVEFQKLDAAGDVTSSPTPAGTGMP